MDNTATLMTESQYRQLDIDSYSSIKLFIEDRKKYYRKFVLKEPMKEEESTSTTFGSLVDCLRLCPDEFDNKFAVSITDIPTGQYAKLIKELMRVTTESVNERGEVGRDLEDMLEEAYNRTKFDRNGAIIDFKRDSFETVKNKFVGSELEIYYKYLRESHGKLVVEPSAIDKAQQIVLELSANPITSNIILAETSDTLTVYNQFPVVEDVSGLLSGDVFESGSGYNMKGLIDKIIIDHELKTISIYDLKTTWDNEGEFVLNYFKYKYYIQAALYYYLIVEWAKDAYKDYSVKFPEFIVAESSNYKSPLIYTTDYENFIQGMRGFEIRGRYYPGIVRALSDLLWHKRTGIWNISKENHDNSGIVKIKPFKN